MMGKVYDIAPKLFGYETDFFLLPKTENDLLARLPSRVCGVGHGLDQDVV